MLSLDPRNQGREGTVRIARQDGRVKIIPTYGWASHRLISRVTSVIDVRMLGPVQVVDAAGSSIDLSGRQQRGLLALLALRTPEMVASGVIIESLWDSASLAGPDAALHMAVSRLRADIGRDRILTEPGGYSLDLPLANTDVHRFRALERRGRQLQALGHPLKACESFRHALSLWRGTALADLRDFEFAEQASRRLEEERVATVEHLMAAMLAAGEHDIIIGELFGLVEAFPYRERLWKLLMLALYRSGRQAGALAAFKELRTTLGNELGLEPSDELADLEERILLQDPALADFQPAPADLGDHVEYVRFSPGDTIVREGDDASSVYWVEEGEVEVLKIADEGTTLRLAELGPGRYFGELAATLGARRTATVRAVLPTTVSVHNLDSFRSRLATERTKALPRSATIDDLWDLMRAGQYLHVFDMAAERIERDSSPEIRYLAVLALARAGATAQARRRYVQYGLDRIDPATLPRQLAEDLAVLSARLDKDVALAHRNQNEGTAWARRAAIGYAKAFQRGGSAYHAVNAATMWLLAGDQDTAHTLASRALNGSTQQGHGYWDAVTEAEAALILDDLSRARTALEKAGDPENGKRAQRATTLKQLKLVCELTGADPDILTPLLNPTVVHYCGHRILPPECQGRFPAGEESRVRQELDAMLGRLNAGIGFGSLAAGADILAAEALLARGAELHVVLPFHQDEFAKVSVAPAGNGWVERYLRCLDRASSVRIASSGEYLDDPVMFDFCARIAMGDALIRAQVLQTEAHQVAVWDGTDSTHAAGTAIDIRTWTSTGAASTVITVPSGDPPEVVDSSSTRRHIRALVFADFAGFSKLTDAQVLRFQDQVMGSLASQIEKHRPALLSGRTWGDGIYLVFKDVGSAAECALDLVQAIDEMDLGDLGLPQLRGLRVAAHAAPVFEGWDLISGNYLFYGAGVTQAARIEPRTPEGEIYTTQAFAALAMLSGSSNFECQYVGTLPTAKQFGDMPLFALRRSETALVSGL